MMCISTSTGLPAPLVLLVILLCADYSRADDVQRAADRTRQTLPFPLEPLPASPWTVEAAFGDLKIPNPIYATHAAGDPLATYVLTRDGKVLRITADGPRFRAQTLLDISDRVVWSMHTDDGALGLAFHPQYGKTAEPRGRSFFVYYITQRSEKRYYRVSRFERDNADLAARAASEQVLIEQWDEDHAHNGGCLQFGPDGFLYISVGDEGQHSDLLANSQRIDRDLFSGVLRIDVDQIGGDVSHQPPRQPQSGTTAHYFIPNDNPFVGRDGALEEFWAIGMRSPHRMAFDQVTGQLWGSDVGQDDREEINIIQRGGNYLWSRFEGSQRFGTSDSPAAVDRAAVQVDYGVPTWPVLEYAHGTLNNCVIGGHVQRASSFPELEGKYLFGDWGSGRIWSLAVDDTGAKRVEELLRIPVAEGRILSFGEGANGETLVCLTRDKLLRLTRASPWPEKLPRRLSETGVFANLQTLTPSEGFIPYEVNLPFWSDGVAKQRWIRLPQSADGSRQRIVFHDDAPWEFPAGTVFVKHFAVSEQNTNGDQDETRILVTDLEGGVYGLSYRWNVERSDAFLVQQAQSVDIRDADGQSTAHRGSWYYPSPADCLVCHTRQSGSVLGVNTRQLNRSITVASGESRNQLDFWKALEMFVAGTGPRDVSELPRHAAVEESEVPLVERVRSYLAVNCSQCHQPGSMIAASIDARPTTPLAEQGLLYGKMHKKLGDFLHMVTPGSPRKSLLLHRLSSERSGIRMPPFTVSCVDQAAVAMISEWIRTMEPTAEALGRMRVADRPDQRLKLEFRSNQAHNRLIGSIAGTATGSELISTEQGLNVMLSRVADAPATQGVEVKVNLEGDFEIAASYQILELDNPGGGHGAGVTLVVGDTGNRWASLQRIRKSDGANVYVVHRALPQAGAGHVHMAETQDTSATRGQLCLRRIGETLLYSVAEEDATQLRQIGSLIFSKSGISMIRFGAQNGEYPTRVRIRLTDMEIRAERLTVEGETSEQTTTDQTIPPPRTFWLVWAAAPFPVLMAWLWLGRRR